MAMRITDRDQTLIRWVNGFGYVSVSQVADFMAVDFSTAARRIRLLCDGGVIERKAFPLSTMSVLIPTRDGSAVTGDDLAPIAGVRVATSRHDLMLVDCARALEQRFKMRFEPERRLRQRGFGNADHLPDGLLHRQDAPPIAVELELSQKPPRRLEAILDTYAAHPEVAEAWYVVVDEGVEKFVRRFAEGRPYVTVRRWRNTLTKTHSNAAK